MSRFLWFTVYIGDGDVPSSYASAVLPSNQCKPVKSNQIKSNLFTTKKRT